MESGGLFFRLLAASVLALEPLDPSGGVQQLLAAGVKRVAARADFHADVALVRGARPEGAPAGARDVQFIVSRVNASLHSDLNSV